MTTRNDLQIYTFQAGEAAHAVRVLMRNGEPWFVAADICRALDIGNPSDALSRLEDDERSTGTLDSTEGSSGGNPNVNVVNQYGLYTLVLGSRKPEAKPFKRWITHEVLPSIARHGVYIDADNRMGQTLGAATDGVVRVEQSETDLALAMRHVAASLIKLTERLDRTERDHAQSLRALRQEMARTIGRVVRVSKAHRPSNKNADPNRPLSDDDVERFKYLLGTGATAKQIARSLNRTYAVIQRFIETNQDLVIRTLQHTLL